MWCCWTQTARFPVTRLFWFGKGSVLAAWITLHPFFWTREDSSTMKLMLAAVATACCARASARSVVVEHAFGPQEKVRLESTLVRYVTMKIEIWCTWLLGQRVSEWPPGTTTESLLRSESKTLIIPQVLPSTDGCTLRVTIVLHCN